MEPKDLLITARENKGMSQQALGAAVGVSSRMIQRYEQGIFPKYKSDSISAIDRELGTNLYEIIYDKNVPRGNSNLNEEGLSYTQKRNDHKNNSTKKEVPVYGGYSSLGNITVYDDDNLKNEVIGTLPPNIFPNCDYAEKAKGDSMYPIIMNQALLVGKRCTAKGITYGEKYIIKTKDGLDTTKYVHPVFDENKRKIEGRILLIAHNKSIPPQELELEDVVFSCRVHWIVNPT